MKVDLFLLVYLVVWSVNCTAQSSPMRQKISVLSYNIHHGEGADGQLDLARIADVIKHSKADIVALQEVDVRVSRSRNVDQPQHLAQMLDMHVVFGGNIELDGGQYGNAVLSRYPIKSQSNYLLPNTNGGEQRGVLSVELEIASDTHVTLLATHLDHRRDPTQRVDSAKYINQLMASDSKSQIFLLAGDLNAAPDSSVLNEFETRWRRSSLTELATIPVDNPARQIDYVLLARPSSHAQVVAIAKTTRVLDETLASDHRPILAELELRTKPSKEKVISRVAFGSCIQQDLELPIFATILNEKPELMLFLGDNIYADTSDLPTLRTKYAKLDGKPEFQRLVQTTRVMATWDDHDYGKNDGGADFNFRDISKNEFLNFWNEPLNSPRRLSPGVYDVQVFGPPGKRLQVILLDTRYFRSPLKQGVKRVGGAYVPDVDEQKTMLGEDQWAWLEQQLMQPADVRLLVSSIQCIPSDAGQETWSNFPHERQRLLNLIERTQAKGMVILSGDRHWSELSVLKRAGHEPLYELTSSSFNQEHARGTPTDNPYRAVPNTYHKPNYGWIDITWLDEATQVSLQIRDLTGNRQLEKSLLIPRGSEN